MKRKFLLTESKIFSKQLSKQCDSTFCKKIQIHENIFLSKMKTDNNCFQCFRKIRHGAKKK